MLILTIRTDKPEAELGLYEDATPLAKLEWPAHRQLAETIHIKINDLLTEQSKPLKNIDAIVAYQGPGSFTGLRIGLTVANTLSESLGAKIVGTTGDKWEAVGIQKLLAGGNDRLVMPEYGASVHITAQKH